MVLSALDGWLVGCVMVQETCRARGDARSSTSSQPNTYTLHQIDRPTRQITRQIYLYICAFIIFTFRIFIYRQIDIPARQMNGFIFTYIITFILDIILYLNKQKERQCVKYTWIPNRSAHKIDYQIDLSIYICAFIIFTFRIFIYRQIVRQSDRKIEREQSQILFYRNKLGQHTKVIFMPQDRLTDTTFQTNIYYIYDSIFLNRQKERLTDRKIYPD